MSGRRSAIFCLQVFLAVFSHLGDKGFESRSAVILWLEHFYVFFPFLMKIESLVSEGETGKWRRGEGEGKEKLILGRDGLCTGYSFTSQHPACLGGLLALKGSNMST